MSVAGQGALSEYEVDARDAHAWPELYFQGLGWVPFEPTPSRGVVPDYATEASAPGPPDSLDNNDDLLPEPGQVPTPAPSAAPRLRSRRATERPTPVAAPAVAAGRRRCPGRRPAAGFAAAGAAGDPGPPAPAPGNATAAAPLAWAELRDLGTDYGLPPGPSETPRAYSARLRRSHCWANRAEWTTPRTRLLPR